MCVHLTQSVTKLGPNAFKHLRVPDLRRTVSTAKQSSAELMASSPYPCLPSIQIQAGRPPSPTRAAPSALQPSFGTLSALAQKILFRRQLFLQRQEEEVFWGRGGGVGWGSCVVRLSGVNNKAHFCVGELEIGHEQCSELFTDSQCS